MSPRRIWDSPNPTLASECAPPTRTGGGEGQTRLRVRGWGSPNSNDWRKSLALCLLCGQEAFLWKYSRISGGRELTHLPHTVLQVPVALWKKIINNINNIIKGGKAANMVHSVQPKTFISGRKEIHCKKVCHFPVPSRDVTDETLHGREKLNYSRPGRVSSVTSRMGTGKQLTLFYSVE